MITLLLVHSHSIKTLKCRSIEHDVLHQAANSGSCQAATVLTTSSHLSPPPLATQSFLSEEAAVYTNTIASRPTSLSREVDR